MVDLPFFVPKMARRKNAWKGAKSKSKERERKTMKGTKSKSKERERKTLVSIAYWKHRHATLTAVDTLVSIADRCLMQAQGKLTKLSDAEGRVAMVRCGKCYGYIEEECGPVSHEVLAVRESLRGVVRARCTREAKAANKKAGRAVVDGRVKSQ